MPTLHDKLSLGMCVFMHTFKTLSVVYFLCLLNLLYEYLAALNIVKVNLTLYSFARYLNSFNI